MLSSQRWGLGRSHHIFHRFSFQGALRGSRRVDAFLDAIISPLCFFHLRVLSFLGQFLRLSFPISTFRFLPFFLSVTKATRTWCKHDVTEWDKNSPYIDVSTGMWYQPSSFRLANVRSVQIDQRPWGHLRHGSPDHSHVMYYRQLISLLSFRTKTQLPIAPTSKARRTIMGHAVNNILRCRHVWSRCNPTIFSIPPASPAHPLSRSNIEKTCWSLSLQTSQYSTVCTVLNVHVFERFKQKRRKPSVMNFRTHYIGCVSIVAS